MDYQKHYDSIINRARTRNLTSYTELHHILPKCLGGDDSLTNLVSLSAREHYIAHQLLVKLHPGNRKIAHAAKMMTVQAPSHNNERSQNRLYEWLKIKTLSIDKTIYKFINIITGERIEGTQVIIRNKTGIGCSQFSSLKSGNKKYMHNWVMCDDNWNLLSTTTDKRRSLTGKEHHKSDKKIYFIKNIVTGELFSGLRDDIKHKLNLRSDTCHAFVNGITGLCRDEWALSDKGGKLLRNIDKKKVCNNGIHNHNSDKNLYTLINLDSKEKFTGNRADIKLKLSINTQQCHHLLKKDRIVNNWKISHNDKIINKEQI